MYAFLSRALYRSVYEFQAGKTIIPFAKVNKRGKG